ncbi:hypothetical protein ABE48_22835 [Bacillus thuringiensis]|nr:hypothetical protein BtSCAC15_31585 [Bacillus thuringiensis]MBG9519856.1 hypothetical protein [Bacillus thuringiensis]MBG9533931.1 hypothetical protein [Bacillus thuringiensis]
MVSSKSNEAVVLEYAHSVAESKKIVGKEIKQTCQRFLDDMNNSEYDFRTRDAEFVIQVIEKMVLLQSLKKV